MEERETAPSNAIRCPCGHERENKLVAPRAEYTLWGWILIGIGISTCPQSVHFSCVHCGFAFPPLTTPQECERFRYRT